MNDLVNENCNFKRLETLKNEYCFDKKMYFQWMQLIHGIPVIWKKIIVKNMFKKTMSYNINTY